MWNWDDGHVDDGWGIAMMLGMLGFWVLLAAAVVLGIVWAIRSTGTPAAGSADGLAMRSPEQILAERLARGDIDPEEYQTRLAALAARGPS